MSKAGTTPLLTNHIPGADGFKGCFTPPPPPHIPHEPDLVLDLDTPYLLHLTLDFDTSAAVLKGACSCAGLPWHPSWPIRV